MIKHSFEKLDIKSEITLQETIKIDEIKIEEPNFADNVSN